MLSTLASSICLTPSRAQSISCVLTIACALLVHQANGHVHRPGIDIVRLPRPPSLLAPTPPHARPAGRFINLTARIGSLPAGGQKGWLGLKMQQLELALALSLGRSRADGVLVVETTAGGPAQQSAVRSGDILISYDGNALESANDLRKLVLATPPQSEVLLIVWRSTSEDGNFLQLLRGLAESGNAYVMYHLGSMYDQGSGVARDPAEAIRWYRKGSDAGNSSAMTSLAMALMEGRIASKDEQAGLRLLRSAAEKGNPEAMRQLALHMLAGTIATKDTAEAERLLTKAAADGHAPSMADLGALYDNRKNEADWKRAAMWYARASDRGNPMGMVNLGILHERGNGVPRDDAAAVTLYKRAADDGHAGGMYELARMLDDGKGVERPDPDAAADLILQSLELRHEFSYRQMTQNSRAWTLDFRRALQSKLQVAGSYLGRIDGELGPSTIAALNAYINRRR